MKKCVFRIIPFLELVEEYFANFILCSSYFLRKGIVVSKLNQLIDKPSLRQGKKRLTKKYFNIFLSHLKINSKQLHLSMLSECYEGSCPLEKCHWIKQPAR